MRKDIDLNFTTHPLTKDLVVLTNEKAVKQSLRNIVLTNFYERGFNVEVGSNVMYQLFENVDPLMLLSMKEDIERSINNFEPDVDLIEVITQQDENTINVLITYTVLNNPKEERLAIPFKLIR